ncbi:MAG: caspase family protein [Albidovulum sp.]|uniref:caspase family protein n=1 Tax=Albidovulum sp. TaxID=1872424 RepID=UPI003CA8B78F
MQDRKIALVIGNGAYRHATRLDAPRRDARTMATTLERVGFEVLAPGFDSDYHDFRSRTDDFIDRLRPDTIALFYYSGHGAQAPDGSNHMLPVSERLVDTRDFGRITIPLDNLLAQMRAKARVSLLFLDACRDDPFAMGETGNGTKSIEIGRMGLSPVSTEHLGQALIAYAAEEGHVAFDAGGGLSAFTAALSRHLATPGAEIRDVLTTVCRDVVTETGGRQTPWTKNALHESVILIPVAEANGASDPEPAPARSTPQPPRPDVPGLRSSIIVLLQERLHGLKHYNGPIDGDVGPMMLRALDETFVYWPGAPAGIETWDDDMRLIAFIQLWCHAEDIDGGPVDGEFGPLTARGAESLQKRRASDELNLEAPLVPAKPIDEAVGAQGPDLAGNHGTTRQPPAVWKVLGAAIAVAAMSLGVALLTERPPRLLGFEVMNAHELRDPSGHSLILSRRPEPLELTVTAQDRGWSGDLRYEFLVLRKQEDGDWVRELNGIGRDLRFVPELPGLHDVRYLVTDGGLFNLWPKRAEVGFQFSVNKASAPEPRIRLNPHVVTLGDGSDLESSGTLVEPGPRPETYEWRVLLEGGIVWKGQGENVTFLPEKPGNYIVELEVTDSYGQRGTGTAELRVVAPRLEEPRIRADRLVVSRNESVNLKGLPHDDDLTFVWSVGDDPARLSTSDEYVFSSTTPGGHVVHFKVGDRWGQSDSASETITVLEPAELDQAFLREVNGTKVYDYSGRELILNGSFVTGGDPILIRAHTIRAAQATIQAFPVSAQPGSAGASGPRGSSGSGTGTPGAAGGSGELGGNGSDGGSAGNIRIEAERLFGTLRIDNSGQSAGSGGQGGAGGAGGNGARGNNASSGAFDCSRGPQNGGNGGAGGDAGRGGNGGDGGDAGAVEVRLGEVDPDALVEVLAQGGDGGAPGSPGTPGSGGAGASRGSANGLCRQTASNGSGGSSGQQSAPGAAGTAGTDGAIQIVIGGQLARVATGTLEFVGAN